MPKPTFEKPCTRRQKPYLKELKEVAKKAQLRGYSKKVKEDLCDMLKEAKLIKISKNGSITFNPTEKSKPVKQKTQTLKAQTSKPKVTAKPKLAAKTLKLQTPKPKTSKSTTPKPKVTAKPKTVTKPKPQTPKPKTSKSSTTPKPKVIAKPKKATESKKASDQDKNKNGKRQRETPVQPKKAPAGKKSKTSKQVPVTSHFEAKCVESVDENHGSLKRKIVTVPVPKYVTNWPTKNLALFQSSGTSNQMGHMFNLKGTFFPTAGLYETPMATMPAGWISKIGYYYVHKEDSVFFVFEESKMFQNAPENFQQAYKGIVKSYFSSWWQLMISASIGSPFWDDAPKDVREFITTHKWDDKGRKFVEIQKTVYKIPQECEKSIKHAGANVSSFNDYLAKHGALVGRNWKQIGDVMEKL